MIRGAAAGVPPAGDELPESEVEAVWRQAQGPFAPVVRPVVLSGHATGGTAPEDLSVIEEASGQLGFAL